jgi:hypothetical protein
MEIENVSLFINTVASMREAQRRYFKTRAYKDLDESKRLEKEVDLMIAEYTSPQNKLL